MNEKLKKKIKNLIRNKELNKNFPPIEQTLTPQVKLLTPEDFKKLIKFTSFGDLIDACSHSKKDKLKFILKYSFAFISFIVINYITILLPEDYFKNENG